MRKMRLLLLAFTMACGGKDTEGMNPGECINGLDDDENGFIDCADPGCLNSPDCGDSGTPPIEAGDEADTGGPSGSGSSAGSSGEGGDGGGASGGDTSGDGGESSGTGSDGGGSAEGSGDGAPLDGPSLYQTYCESCHGPTAEGASGPPLEEEFSIHTDEELIVVILNGAGSMPAIPVSEEEAGAIVDHVRTLF